MNKSRRNKKSFDFYTKEELRKKIEPECTAKFGIVENAEEILLYDNIPYVKITLMANKLEEIDF
jgi:hypothetical protein